MKVFYVTEIAPDWQEPARERGLFAPPGGEDQAPRFDRAKFFDRDHAEAHMATVRGRGLRVEEREETQEEQHHAHGGKVGK
jgi:hypothetical protein